MIFYNKLLASIVEIDIDFYQVASIKGDSKIDVKNGKKKRPQVSERRITKESSQNDEILMLQGYKNPRMKESKKKKEIFPVRLLDFSAFRRKQSNSRKK